MAVKTNARCSTLKLLNLPRGYVPTKNFTLKTFNGETLGSALYIWTDGTNIYYSNNTVQLVLNGDTWETKVWQGAPYFRGSMVFTFGGEIYLMDYQATYGGQKFVLRGDTWEAITYQGTDRIYGRDFITDGTKLYYAGTRTFYECDIRNNIQTQLFTGSPGTSMNGYRFWSDGVNFYFSYGATQKVFLDGQWVAKTWNGMNSFNGDFIWTDGENIYYSFGATQMVLIDDTWTDTSFTGLTSFRGEFMWYDGQNIFAQATEGGDNYQLDSYTRTKYTITYFLSGCSGNINNPSNIYDDETFNISFNALNGFAFNPPTAVQITGCDYTITSIDGSSVSITISNPTENISITITALNAEKNLVLNLYQNSAEEHRVDKSAYITQVGTVFGTFRDESSVTDVDIIIELDRVPNFNYVYIPMFSRWYYVVDISTVRNNLWNISLTVDVLMTYANGIKKLKAFIDRNETYNNPLIIDKKRVIEQGYDVETIDIKNGLFGTRPSYVIEGFYIQGTHD